MGQLFPDVYPTHCNTFYDSISSYVVNNNDKLVNLNLKNSNIYTYSRSGSRTKGFREVCRVVINDTDIIPK